MSSPCTMIPNESIVFDPTMMQNQPKLPKEFIWPETFGFNTFQQGSHDVLNEPLVDLDGFFKGDEEATKHAIGLIHEACSTHGFFQVMNHRVDLSLIRAAHDQMDMLFKLPKEKKFNVQKKKGEMCGYSGAHAHRFSRKLPWKETFSFRFNYINDEGSSSSYKPLVLDYIKSSLGEEFEFAGLVYQRYCEAMKDLSLVIFELLGIGLGVERQYFRKFFEDGTSLLRCNSYPPCKEPGLTFGTGPHCDPTSLTILHQDQVGGLEVFANNKWQLVRPRQDALVINIGDTFMALSNGRYKSCLHRAIVNKKRERRSLVFFVSPREDKIVRAPQDLVNREEGTKSRRYPDFKWSNLLDFTQNHYRADVTTLQSFFQWLPSSNFN